MPDEPLTVTLRAAHAGDRAAADRAYAALYPELLKIARARLRRQAATATENLDDTMPLIAASARAGACAAVCRPDADGPSAVAITISVASQRPTGSSFERCRYA